MPDFHHRIRPDQDGHFEAGFAAQRRRAMGTTQCQVGVGHWAKDAANDDRIITVESDVDVVAVPGEPMVWIGEGAPVGAVAPEEVATAIGPVNDVCVGDAWRKGKARTEESSDQTGDEHGPSGLGCSKSRGSAGREGRFHGAGSVTGGGGRLR